MSLDSFSFICPSCRSALTQPRDDLMQCANGHEYPRIDGIWRMLAPEREPHFARFIQEYEAIRAKEHRGSLDPAYYRNLPYGVTGRWADDWAIRAKSYEAYIRKYRWMEPPNILDVGAGNGWLSHRLAADTAEVVAVDLQTNPFDGLGAYVHYDIPFIPIQAEFDRLPFADLQFYELIFNASFHYSEDYETTLREAFRVAESIAIIDTPIYHSDASGKRMIAERQSHFEQTYGFRSDSLNSEGYLTHARLADLGKALGIRWKLIRPRYGIRWALRRLIGRIRTRREPAEFYVILGMGPHS